MKKLLYLALALVLILTLAACVKKDVTTAPDPSGTQAPSGTSDPSGTPDPTGDAPHEHSYGDWTVVTAATCTEDGEKERVCSCGEKEIELIAATGHGETEIRDAVAATCTTDGYTGDTYCTVCGEKTASGEAISATGHTFGDWTVVTAATCTTDGLKERVCACGEKEAEAIAATGHTEEVISGKDATCTESGLTEGKKCSVCGEILTAQTEIAAKGHGETEIRDVAAATCTADGYTGDTYCKICGEKLASGNALPRTGHTFRWTVVKKATCTAKGEESGVCKNCSYTTGRETSTIAHNYVGNVCTECGAIGPHSCADSNNDHKCDICGATLTACKDDDGDDQCDICGASVTTASEGLAFGLNSDGKSYYVSGIGTCTDTAIVIPSTYNGKPVTGIGYEAFYDNNLTSIVIPNSITSIDDWAFQDCVNLSNVTIPSSVLTIGEGIFCGCTSLTSITVDENNAYYKSVDGNLYSKDGKALIHYAIGKTDTAFTIPESVTSIGNYAFYYCSGLTSITIPDSVTILGDGAFYGCSSLTSITIPDSVTSVGEGAFYNCTGLTSITIPNSVTSVGVAAFRNCTGLTSITIPDSVTSIEPAAFMDCTKLETVIFGENSQLASLGRIHEDSNMRYYGAFEGCTSLTSITIPDGVIILGDGAFYGCSSLTSITIPDSVTNINNYAFYDCTGLTSITIPDSVTSIGLAAFMDCTKLETVTFGENSQLTSLGRISGDSNWFYYGAFQGCTSLTSITIPDGVTILGDRTFHGCHTLTSITIPDSVTSIGGEALFGCSYLRSITFEGTMAQWNAITKGADWDSNTGNYTIIYLGDATGEPTASEGLAFTLNSDGLSYSVSGIGTCTDTAIVIPSTYNGKPVTGIGKSAFQWCTGLTSITIPDGVTSIGGLAFAYCYSLTSITIPDSVTSIAGSAFAWCSNLAGITVSEGNKIYHSDGNCVIETETKTLIVGCNGSVIPTDGSVTSIGDDAFCGSDLREITIPNYVTSIGKRAFENCVNLTSITIGNGVTSIGYWAFVSCYDLTTITVADGNTVYHSDGNCLIETATKTLIAGCQNSVIPTDGSVTAIGEYAFYGCDYLTSITIPDSVTSIGDGAFDRCDSLTSITIPDSVTSIGVVAFDETAYYDNADNWEDGVLYIGNHLIRAKTDISGAYIIKDGTKCIADFAFCDCESLTSITIGNSVTSIGYAAFENCHSLTSVTIGNSVTSIGKRAFEGCSSLTNVTIPDSVTSIEWRAFYVCSSLTNVTIPDSVTSIDLCAFYGCIGLTSITFEGTMEQWNAISKDSYWDSHTGSYTIYCTDGDISK